MIRIFVMAILVLVTQSSALGQAENKTTKHNEKAEQELLRVEKEYLDARVRNDKAAIERVVADDFIGTNSGGQVSGKAETLNSPNTTPGGMKIDSMDIDDTRVRVYGNTAVVTGRRTVKAGDRSFSLRFTHVYVKEKGRWQMVASQVTGIPQQ